jgi:hypothetical protein
MSAPAFAARRPDHTISGPALFLGACAVATAVVVVHAGIGSRQALTHEAAPLLIVPLALWLFFSERYEVTLAVLLLYLGLLDGVLKLASGSGAETLGRDVLLYAITLGAVVRMILRKTSFTLPAVTGIVLAWVAVCLVQVANPADISLAHAVASLRQHLEFIPLFFFGYFVLRSEHRLAGLLQIFVIVGAANGIADLIQAHLSTSQLASWGPGYAKLENGSLTSDARTFYDPFTRQTEVRPPGLGGTDGFGGMICLIALPAAMALLSSARAQVKQVSWLIPATLLAIVGVVTSQTRLDVVGAVIAVIAFLALTLTSRRGLAVLFAAVIVAVPGYFILQSFVSGSANRYSSIAPGSVFGTAVNQRQSTFALLPSYIVDYPLGAGLGTAGPARGTVLGGKVPPALNGESEFSFLLVETGIPGLLVMLAFMIALIKLGVGLRRLADIRLQRYLMALTAVAIALFAAWAFTPVTSDSPTSPFLWLSAGCLAYWYAEMRAGRIRVRPRLVGGALASR